MLSPQSVIFIKTLPDFSPHYDRLRKKRPSLPATDSLRFEGHLFFEGLSDISRDIKSFYYDLFVVEGDMFCKHPMAWPMLLIVINNGLFESVQQLEKYSMIDVPSQVLKEVTDVTASTARMDRKVDWMDETLGKIASKKKHLSLLKRSKELEK